MRLFTSTLCTAVAIGLLAGCSGNMSAPTSTVPGVSASSRTVLSVYDDVAPVRAISISHMLPPDPNATKKKKPKTGIYVSQFYASAILGYPIVNKGNKKPACAVNGVTSVNGVGVDGKGNLMDPDGGSGYLILYKGPAMCGKQLALIGDSYGQASDASSPDAVNGKIALGNLSDTGSAPGSLSICTLAGGCTVNLTNSAIYHAGGVAMSNGGDCWLNAKTSSTGGAALIYFKGCTGGGVVAKGFKSTYYGGIDIDNNGNLVVLDLMAVDAYVYSGCNPKCKVVGGPFAMQGQSFFGKLNMANTQYAVSDRENGSVDVYSYTPKSIKYEYSFTNGLVASEIPEGIAYNPRSKQ